MLPDKHSSVTLSVPYYIHTTPPHVPQPHTHIVTIQIISTRGIVLLCVIALKIFELALVELPLELHCTGFIRFLHTMANCSTTWLTGASIVLFISFSIFKSFTISALCPSCWIRLVSDFLERRTLSIGFLDPKECYEVSRC